MARLQFTKVIGGFLKITSNYEIIKSLSLWVYPADHDLVNAEQVLGSAALKLSLTFQWTSDIVYFSSESIREIFGIFSAATLRYIVDVSLVAINGELLGLIHAWIPLFILFNFLQTHIYSIILR